MQSVASVTDAHDRLDRSRLNSVQPAANSSMPANAVGMVIAAHPVMVVSTVLFCKNLRNVVTAEKSQSVTSKDVRLVMLLAKRVNIAPELKSQSTSDSAVTERQKSNIAVKSVTAETFGISVATNVILSQ